MTRAPLDGIEVDVDPAGVVLTSDTELEVVSSAPVGGGFRRARSVLNVRVPKDHRCDDPEALVEQLARTRGVPAPWVGFLTSASVERARITRACAGPVQALCVATVGLSHRVAAGRSPVVPPLAVGPGTINVIVVVDAEAPAAALVNAALAVTEAKVLALRDTGLTLPDGETATGTPTDAVAIAATGRGPRADYGGPVSALGAAASGAALEAIRGGIADWLDRNPP